jgi:hypothetical protein
MHRSMNGTTLIWVISLTIVHIPEASVSGRHNGGFSSASGPWSAKGKRSMGDPIHLLRECWQALLPQIATGL